MLNFQNVVSKLTNLDTNHKKIYIYKKKTHDKHINAIKQQKNKIQLQKTISIF